MTEQIVFMAPEGTRARLEAVAKEEDRKMGAYLRRLVLAQLDEIDAEHLAPEHVEKDSVWRKR